MINIDYIMGLLDWENSKAIQKEGLLLAESVENFNVFIQPCNQKYNKNIWENCAKIISSKTDEDLFPYISRLFMWLQDLNWPGSYIIFERLLRFEDRVLFDKAYSDSLRCAQALDDFAWEENILMLREMKDTRSSL